MSTSRMITRTRWLSFAGLALALMASGCATVPAPRKDLPDPVDAAVRKTLREPLTAITASTIGMLNNPRLKAGYQQLDIMRADLIQAGLIDNPSLSLAYLTGGSGHAFEAAIMQPLLGLITRRARLQLGAALSQQYSLEMTKSVRDLESEIKSAYYTLTADLQMQTLMAQAQEVHAAAAELAARQYAVGNLSRRDQAQQQVAYAQLALQNAQLETRVANGRERLNRLMGLWGADTHWKLANEIPPLPATAPLMEDAEARAVQQRTEIAIATMDVEYRYRTLGLTRDTRWLPGLSAGLRFERDSDGARRAGPVLEAQIPVFDRGQARVLREAAELARSEHLLTAMAIEVRSEAREAAAQVVTAHAMARHLRDAVLPLHEVIVGEAQKLHNGMLIGVYDLLLARHAQLQAAQQAIEANRDYWLAVTQLERAIGGPVGRLSPPPPTVTPPEQQPGAQQ